MRPAFPAQQYATYFDPEWEIRVNAEHILCDAENAERLPEGIRGAWDLPLLLETAVELARPDLAMAFSVMEGCYIGHTCLTLEMACQNAGMLARPTVAYDPILISKRYPVEYHVRAFGKITQELHSYTRKVTISLIDEEYRGVKSNAKELALVDFPPDAQMELGSFLAEIGHSYGLAIDTCAEKVDLQQFGIEHARYIDGRLFEKLLGCRLRVEKDKTQRLECGCVTSIDIGMYNTCQNGCRYCYANYSRKTVAENYAKHNPHSPLISGEVCSDDKINVREAQSFKISQLRFPD